MYIRNVNSLFFTKPSLCTETPSLDFTPPLFRRRLSQLTKMVIQVIHSQIEEYNCGDIKQFLISDRGEINRQYQILTQLFEDEEILPASFSLAVYNTPVGQASLAMKLKSGYSVLFPCGQDFVQGLQTACAAILSGDEEQILLVYADEQITDDYANLLTNDNTPFAFCTIVSAKELYANSIKIDLSTINKITPQDFYKEISK